MNRRTFLGCLGLAGSIGVAGADRADRPRPLEVIVWFSERAARYDGLRPRVEGFLGGALSAAGAEVRLAFGEWPIHISAEEGADVLTVEWPRRVVGGRLGIGAVEPTADVNLLITDGDPTSQPAGYGMAAVGAMTGARLLATMPPPAETPPVVPVTGPGVVTQLLLHECGHALGLTHGHGSVFEEGDVVVATPMIGRYAWAAPEVRRRQIQSDGDHCDSPYPESSGMRHRLQLHYGRCASRSIRARYGRK